MFYSHRNESYTYAAKLDATYFEQIHLMGSLYTEQHFLKLTKKTRNVHKHFTSRSVLPNQCSWKKLLNPSQHTLLNTALTHNKQTRKSSEAINLLYAFYYEIVMVV